MALVFIRNQKVAGTAINHALTVRAKAWTMPFKGAPDLDQLREKLRSESVVVIYDNRSYLVFSELADDLRRHHTVVSIIRNPYDRYISAWAHSRRRQWCPDATTPVEMFDQHSGFYWEAGYHCFRPQIDSLYDPDGRLVPHHVMHYEALEDDFKTLCMLAGLRHAPLERMNASPHEHWRAYYERWGGLRKRVEEACAPDLLTLPYAFEADQPTGTVPLELPIAKTRRDLSWTRTI